MINVYCLSTESFSIGCCVRGKFDAPLFTGHTQTYEPSVKYLLKAEKKIGSLLEQSCSYPCQSFLQATVQIMNQTYLNLKTSINKINPEITPLCLYTGHKFCTLNNMHVNTFVSFIQALKTALKMPHNTINRDVLHV